MPLELEGDAYVVDIVLDKKGAGAEKELTTDYKLRCVTGADVLAYFDPALRALLFNPETRDPRFKNMKTIKWSGTQRGMDFTIERTRFSDVTLKNFAFDPMAGDKVALSFTAAAYPQPQQIADTSLLMETDVQIKVHANGQLDLEGTSGKVHRTESPQDPAPDVKPLQEALDKAEKILTDPAKPAVKLWPIPDAKGLYPIAGELLRYRDDTLHINCWAGIRLLQIGPEAWVGAIDYQLAGEDPVPKALDFHCKRMESRAAALLRESSDLIRACEAWEKANKRSVAANRKAVAALCKWAQGLVLGGSPTPLADPPKAAKKGKK